MAASIRKSGLEIENRCTDCPRFNFFAASIYKSGLEIKNRCNTIVPASITARLQQVLPLRCRVRLQFSSPQNRTARLQHSRGAQAGTGCHEGGIILSKKPPEWCLSLPQQRSASDSNLRRRKVERSASDSNLRCGKEERKDIHKMMQLIYGRILNLATGDFWKI